VSALRDLYDQIVALFAADQETTSVVFGYRQAAQQTNQGGGRANRVVIEPMDQGLVGVDQAARGVGGTPLHTSDFLAAATIYIWAIDPNLPNDERSNYEAVDKLRMKVRVALHKAAAGRIWIGKYQRVVTSNERPFGFEWKVTIGIKEEDIDVLHENVQVIRDPQPTIDLQLPTPEGT